MSQFNKTISSHSALSPRPSSRRWVRRGGGWGVRGGGSGLCRHGDGSLVFRIYFFICKHARSWQYAAQTHTFPHKLTGPTSAKLTIEKESVGGSVGRSNQTEGRPASCYSSCADTPGPSWLPCLSSRPQKQQQQQPFSPLLRLSTSF